MALVVLLRGVNVGGRRTFRPTALAAQLQHLEAVNVGAAGTFIVRRRVGQAKVRAEFARRLPFDTDIVICEGRDIVRLLSSGVFAGHPVGPDTVRFVSVLAQRPRAAPATPIRFPETGRWLVQLLARYDRLVCGVYRRHMKTIGYLAGLDRLYGVPVTTRNWNTVTAIAKVLQGNPT